MAAQQHPTGYAALGRSLTEDDLSAVRAIHARAAGPQSEPAPHHAPWVQHLSAEDVDDFTAELVSLLWNDTEPDTDLRAHEVIAGWRATARIKADPTAYREARTATGGDSGPVAPPEDH